MLAYTVVPLVHDEIVVALSMEAGSESHPSTISEDTGTLYTIRCCPVDLISMRNGEYARAHAHAHAHARVRELCVCVCMLIIYYLIFHILYIL